MPFGQLRLLYEADSVRLFSGARTPSVCRWPMCFINKLTAGNSCYRRPHTFWPHEAATIMARIPEAWPLLLDREQLCAFINVPSETVERILDVAPLDLGGGILRWNRIQIEEWAQSLKPRIQKTTKNEKQKQRRKIQRQKLLLHSIESQQRMHRSFINQIIRRIDKYKSGLSKDDNLAHDVNYIAQYLFRAADLYCVCGERDAPLFERLEREVAEMTGRIAEHERDERPAQVRARALVHAAKEHIPDLNLLSSS